MSHSPLLRALCLGLCALSLTISCQALEIPSGETYEFSQEDFDASLTGLCLTQVPQDTQLMLGSRVLRPGDVLTAQQLSQIVLKTTKNPEDVRTSVTYLPIHGSQIAPAAQMDIYVVGTRDDAPLVSDMNLETYQNLPLEGSLTGTDPEGKELTFSLIRQGKRGTVELHPDGSFLYTPKKNKTGTDSFTYAATDPAGNVSAQATVTIRVLRTGDKEQYADTVSLPCRFSAEWMRHNGIFTGQQVAGVLCFQPQEEVNRGQFLAMLLRALEIQVPEEVSFQGFDQDIPLWLRPYLAAALQAGLIRGQQGDSGLNWRAGETMTVQEAQELIQSVLGEEVWNQEVVPVWAAEDQSLTRAHAAMLLYQAHLAKQG